MQTVSDGAGKHTSCNVCVCVFFFSVRREIEYLKKETAQRRAHEESEATHKEEADNLQEKVRKSSPLCFPSKFIYIWVKKNVLI